MTATTHARDGDARTEETATAKPHPAQEAFVADENDETAYIGGVGSGKTTGGTLRVGRHVADWNPGEMGVIVSPTVPMMRNAIIPELRKWGLLDRPGVEFKRSENRIEYANDSVVILESANNDRKIERLRAMNLAWAWVDEAAYLPAKVYRILNDRLRVGQYRNLFATTTPRGFNWVYDEFADLTDPVERSVADGQLLRTDTTTAIVGVSTRSNPGNPDDYIRRQERQRSGEGYEQEIEGEFVNFEGLVYDWFDEDNLVDDVPGDYDEVIYGVDWGHNNPAVVLPLLRDGESWVVADEWYERRCTTGDQARAAADFVEEYGEGVIYCDPSEPSNIHEFRRDYGLPAKPAENDVSPGIRKVTEHRDALSVVRRCQNVRTEFSQYQYKDGGAGEAPLKQNDHALDALRYALFTHTPRDQSDTDSSGVSYL
jgi:PBSX family phage terminase large subunit